MTDGWRTVRIGNWGEVRGGRQRSPHLTRGTMRPYLRVANVHDGRIDTGDVLQMPFTDAEFAQYALRPGDILLNEGQSSELVGRSAIYDGPPDTYAFQNTLVRFRAGPECDPVFAQEVFRELWKKGVFERIATKTTSIAHLGMGRFADLRVRVPLRGEQQRVAGYLRRHTIAATKLGELLILKHQFRRAVTADLLSGGSHAYRLAARSGWTRIKIGDLLEPVSRPVQWDDHATYPLLSIRRRNGGVFHRGSLTGTGIKTKSLFVVREGDIVISRMQAVHGAVARVPATYDGFNVSGMYLVLRTKSPQRLDPAYFDYACRLRSMYRTLLTSSHGVHIEKMTFDPDKFLRAEVEIPSTIAEQRRIARIVGLLDRDVGLAEEMAAAYAEQKRGLMQRLLAGDVPLPAAPAPPPALAHA